MIKKKEREVSRGQMGKRGRRKRRMRRRWGVRKTTKGGVESVVIKRGSRNLGGVMSYHPLALWGTVPTHFSYIS